MADKDIDELLDNPDEEEGEEEEEEVDEEEEGDEEEEEQQDEETLQTQLESAWRANKISDTSRIRI